MKIKCAHTEIRDIVNLVPHPRNSNKHPEKQIKLLAKIMKHQGWRHPITVSKRSGYVVSGHGRLDAAKLNGWDKAPVDLQDFENEADEFAHLIADNKIAELAEHDDSLMIDGIKELELEDFELLGLDDFELEVLAPLNDLDDEDKNETDKQYIIEVHFPNEMEMADIRDDLLHRGYIVKEK